MILTAVPQSDGTQKSQKYIKQVKFRIHYIVSDQFYYIYIFFNPTMLSKATSAAVGQSGMDVWHKSFPVREGNRPNSLPVSVR